MESNLHWYMGMIGHDNRNTQKLCNDKSTKHLKLSQRQITCKK